VSDCPTGKITFGSRAAACHSRKSGRNQGRKMRAYLCQQCHQWHLTTEAYVR
jgi:hypothetical protein